MSVLYGQGAAGLLDLFSQDSRTRLPHDDPSWNELGPVWSGGQTDSPDIALIFINPTYRNQAAAENWPDEYRAPHIGFARIWEFLASCKLMPELEFPSDREWIRQDASGVYQSAAESGLYITNLVKACRTTSAMPTASLAREYLGLMSCELELVKPRAIITFGALTTSVMAGHPFRMRDAYESNHVMALGSEGVRRLIFPSYFPCGRGEPAKAREMVTRITRSIRE